ncbi:MAG: PD40 domain-containing protein [Candidatus Aminicenantes bacterium]|nr:PD40 domain-containing protein [Candidatus Aminicenantes bacterium]
MDLTIKKIISWFKWIIPAAVISGLALFAYYYLSSVDLNVEIEEPAVKEIARGWGKIAGGRNGKVIFGQPPKMVIVDLSTGSEHEVPNVVVGGAKGRFKRGQSPRPSWSPDGKRFLYRYNGSIYACDEQGNRQEIRNERMNCTEETRWSWHVKDGEDWAVGPSKDGDGLVVKISNPAIAKTVYGGGDVVKHCEMTGTGKYIVYARRRDVFVARVGTASASDSRQISTGQSCRPCAAPGNHVAWLPIPHTQYMIHDARDGRQTGVLPAPPGEEIYRLNWSNHPDFAVHMYGSRGNVRIHVRRISTGEYLFTGNGWDPDLWVEDH